MKRNKLAIAIVGGVASLSLLGLGAGASFTDAVAATQQVTAGTMNMGIAEAGGAKSWSPRRTTATSPPTPSTSP